MIKRLHNNLFKFVMAVVIAAIAHIPMATTAMAEPSPDSLSIHDFADASAFKRIEVSGALSRQQTADGLQIAIAAKQHATVVVRPATRRWDLSAWSRAVLDFTNESGDARVHVRVRLDNLKATDWSDSALNDGFAYGGERRLFNVFMFRDWTDWKQYAALTKFPGMNGVPGGMMWHWHYIDAADVRVVRIDFDSPGDQPIKVTLHKLTMANPVVTPEISDPKFFPFVDEFGQYKHADWAGKIVDAAALSAAHQAENADLASHLRCASWDQFGGWKDGPQLKASGHFRAEKVEGRWWLVDPDGRLFWSHGVCCIGPESGETSVRGRETFFETLPPTTGLTAAAWKFDDQQHPQTVNFLIANETRRFGADWKAKSADLAIRRLESWGMNTVGNWSSADIEQLHRLPYTHAIHLWAPKISDSQFDVFDPGWQVQSKTIINDSVRNLKDDPWCIGVFIDNEIGWTGSAHDFIAKLFAIPPYTATKKQFVAALREAFHDQVNALNVKLDTKFSDWDAVLACDKKMTKEQVDQIGPVADEFYKRYCNLYFDTVGTAIKAAAPNKLYLGCRMNVFNDVVVTSAARYCDVLSFNLYRSDVSSFSPSIGIDKPVLVSEFHFGALDRGLLHPGLQSASDQRDRAEKYRSYVTGALRNPYIVGTHWFAYAPEPLTARVDGENYQDGLVDVCDGPYPETRDAIRDCRRIYEIRTK